MSASVDNITINFSDDIDNISISYLDSVENISLDYLTDIDNISLSLGDSFAMAGVSTVNGESGDVVLSASAELVLTTTSAGYYDHFFVHNLGNENVIVSVFDPQKRLVFSEIINEGADYVNIRASINLTGYKAVAQK